jgi:integrase/recombinase XerC
METRMEERPLERWIKQYLDYITYERNFSPYTVEGRQKLLYFFLKFAGLTPLSTSLIRDFLRFLAQERKWNAVSVSDALTHIKVLTRYLYFTGITPEDFSYRIPRPKLPQLLPKTIPVSEIKKLYSMPHFPTNCKRITITYNFYFELLAKTGLRKTESRLLCRKDFNFEDGTLHIRFGKGRRETYTLIPPDMAERLKRWFDERELVPDDLVFIGREGRILDRESIRFAIQARAKWAGINRRIYPHLLRHSFCTELLKQDVSMLKVQRLMRHKRITSTQVYADLVVEDLKTALAKHPLIRKRKPQEIKPQTVINVYNPTFTTPDPQQLLNKLGGDTNVLPITGGSGPPQSKRKAKWSDWRRLQT